MKRFKAEVYLGFAVAEAALAVGVLVLAQRTPRTLGSAAMLGVAAVWFFGSAVMAMRE